MAAFLSHEQCTMSEESPPPGPLYLFLTLIRMFFPSGATIIKAKPFFLANSENKGFFFLQYREVPLAPALPRSCPIWSRRIGRPAGFPLPVLPLQAALKV